jgi:hypothetical protein
MGWICPDSFGTSVVLSSVCMLRSNSYLLRCSAVIPSCSQDRLTLWNLVVCALTAAKGVSGSGASIFAVACY